MNHQIIHTDRIPEAAGPISQAVVARGATVYVSGQVALNATTGAMISPDDIKAQTHQVMQNLEAALQASGAAFQDVVKATIYLTSMKDFDAVDAVYGEYFDHAIAPARVCVAVSELWGEAKVEIDCVAVIHD